VIGFHIRNLPNVPRILEDDGSFEVDVEAPETATVYQPVIDALRWQ
jgi:hypothetical protein